MSRVGGIILCGGESKRMGKPKAWLPFGDEVMLHRVARILGTVVQPLVVAAAPDQDLPPLPADISLARDAERGRGPLAGLATGLAALSGKCDAAFLSGCDVPFLQGAFVQRMVELLGHYAVCVLREGDLYHPLAAVYRLDVYDAAQRLIAANRLRPVFLFEEVPTRIVSPHEVADVDPELRSLRNLNTWKDYEAAIKDMDLQTQ
jgi:molybdopterin-guanine dinucleotide biosynthesis protein A